MTIDGNIIEEKVQSNIVEKKLQTTKQRMSKNINIIIR